MITPIGRKKPRYWQETKIDAVDSNAAKPC